MNQVSEKNIWCFLIKNFVRETILIWKIGLISCLEALYLFVLAENSATSPTPGYRWGSPFAQAAMLFRYHIQKSCIFPKSCHTARVIMPTRSQIYVYINKQVHHFTDNCFCCNFVFFLLEKYFGSRKYGCNFSWSSIFRKRLYFRVFFLWFIDISVSFCESLCVF